jgi:hypothetical protein
VSGALSTTFRVGCRYRCTISLPVSSLKNGTAAIETKWEPSVPDRLTSEEISDYRRGRDILLAEVARYIGGNVAVVEL